MATTEYSYGPSCKPLVDILKTSNGYLKFKIMESYLNNEIPNETKVAKNYHWQHTHIVNKMYELADICVVPKSLLIIKSLCSLFTCL